MLRYSNARSIVGHRLFNKKGIADKYTGSERVEGIADNERCGQVFQTQCIRRKSATRSSVESQEFLKVIFSNLSCVYMVSMASLRLFLNIS